MNTINNLSKKTINLNTNSFLLQNVKAARGLSIDICYICIIFRKLVFCLGRYNLNQQMIKYLLLTLLIAAATSFKQQNGVLILTQADFAEAVRNFPYLFVKFHTPWCGHCKKLSPIFIELANQLKATNPDIKLAEVDLEESKELQSQLRIGSFPTLLFYKNAVSSKFGGDRSKQVMSEWLKKKILDPIIATNVDNLANIETDGKVNIVFFGDVDSTQGKILLNLAKVDDYNMYYSISASDRTSGSVEMYRPFGQTVKIDKVDHSIKAWINLYDRPFVYQFDDRTRSELFSQKRNGVVLFTSEGQVGARAVSVFEQVAENWKVQQKKKLIFTELKSSSSSYSGISEHMKIDPLVTPVVYIKSAEGLKYVYNGKLSQITATKITEFVKSVEAGKIKKYKTQEQTRKNKQPSTEL